MINYGEMRTRGIVFDDGNSAIPSFHGLASDDLLNLGNGRLATE